MFGHPFIVKELLFLACFFTSHLLLEHQLEHTCNCFKVNNNQHVIIMIVP